eukprot:jgi/Ulvmu1/8437/UM043_0015.1
MTTGLTQTDFAAPISPQRPNAVQTAKEDVAAAMKILQNRRKRRSQDKRKFNDDPGLEERKFRLEQAKAELASIKEQGPLLIDSSAFTAEMDEVEPESEFNCFDCQLAPSRDDSEQRLREWMDSNSANTAAPALIASLRGEDSAVECLSFIAHETHDLQIQGDVVPAEVCQIIFTLLVYGDTASSSAAFNLLTYLLNNPVDITCVDRLKAGLQTKPMSNTGVACGLEWLPPDSFWMQAWQALGYVPPGTPIGGGVDGREVKTRNGTSVRVVETASRVAAAQCFCTPAAICRPPQHPLVGRVCRLCRTLTLLEQAYHAQHPGPSPTVPPPFGSDPAFAAVLCRTAADATLPAARDDAAGALTSYLSMHAPGDDHAWGRHFVAAVHDLRQELPSSQALVRVCRGLTGSARCVMLRQALAMASLEAMHGGPEKLPVTDVADVPALDVLRKLPDWREMLKTMTPPNDEVPFGWEVLSTAELLDMLLAPAVAEQLEAARGGSCPLDTISRTVVPLLDGLAKGLKNRRTVSVFRTRLFCSNMATYYADVHSTLRAVAQARMAGEGPINLMAS